MEFCNFAASSMLTTGLTKRSTSIARPFERLTRRTPHSKHFDSSGSADRPTRGLESSRTSRAERRTSRSGSELRSRGEGARRRPKRSTAKHGRSSSSRPRRRQSLGFTSVTMRSRSMKGSPRQSRHETGSSSLRSAGSSRSTSRRTSRPPADETCSSESLNFSPRGEVALARFTESSRGPATPQRDVISGC